MSCGCGDKKNLLGENVDPTELPEQPGQTEAQEMLAPPRSRIEEARPVPRSSDRLFVEFNPQPLAAAQQTPGLPSVWKMETPLSGLTFGGTVPWNVVALVVPLDQLASLVTSPAQLFAMSESVTMDGAVSGVRQIAGLDQFWVMRARRGD